MNCINKVVPYSKSRPKERSLRMMLGKIDVMSIVECCINALIW